MYNYKKKQSGGFTYIKIIQWPKWQINNLQKRKDKKFSMLLILSLSEYWIFQYNFYHKNKCFKGSSDIHELYLLAWLFTFYLVPVLKLESILATKWMKLTDILYYITAVTFQFNYVSIVKSFIDLLGIIINAIWLWCWALTISYLLLG